jgi:hypothetical protein
MWIRTKGGTWMSLPPFTEAKLWDVLNEEISQLTPAQDRLWAVIGIPPVKWTQHPYGDSNGGFWVVAIFGLSVAWFNHIEGGFDISPYARSGEIGAYGASQFTLSMVLERILGAIQFGYDTGPRMGPPQPGEFNPRG